MNNAIPRHMTPEEIAESCEQAAAVLEGHWIVEAWVSDDGQRYCLEGGLAAALGVDARELSHDPILREALAYCPVYRAVRETVLQADEIQEALEEGNLRTLEGEPVFALSEWNDEWADEQKVLDVLHATAKRVLGVEP